MGLYVFMKQSAESSDLVLNREILPGEIALLPEKVQQMWLGIENQGFKVLSVTRRNCDESDETVWGLLGWVILVKAKESHREPWRVWVFDHDPLSEVEAIAVDVEIA